MNMIAAQEIKRRGMAALDGMLASGPVRIVKNNRPRYVVITEADFDSMLADLADELGRLPGDWRTQREDVAALMARMT